MRKKKRTKRRTTTFVSDEVLIENLEQDAPELLRTTVSEAEFEATLDRLLTQSPTTEIQHFYCRKCGEYHLKSNPHHRTTVHVKK